MEMDLHQKEGCIISYMPSVGYRLLCTKLCPSNINTHDINCNYYGYNLLLLGDQARDERTG